MNGPLASFTTFATTLFFTTATTPGTEKSYVQESFRELLGQAKTLGARLLWAIPIFLVFWLLSFAGRWLIMKAGRSFRLNEVILDLLAQLMKVVLLLIGVVVALGTLGINVSAIIASFGVAGFAVGFALKDVLSNILSGLMLLSYRPFWVNDRIKVAGQEGIVTDIDLRYTKLQDGAKEILIPNSSMFTSTVEVLARSSTGEEAPPGDVSHTEKP